eukprot:CAMPEP_0194300314 /NCGR_PEP_ID=MMETSP0169-20130528/61189_1 /TAXON_ID=218684 /ORGANISM="Corethron pennatum, Strain L29A3" /LENGTH=84 /DNA_ID=CAMNT_0039050469 /DNA_START=588 /DNA_END=842 /DNA_ORIENTATION=-
MAEAGTTARIKNVVQPLMTELVSDWYIDTIFSMIIPPAQESVINACATNINDALALMNTGRARMMLTLLDVENVAKSGSPSRLQ